MEMFALLLLSFMLVSESDARLVHDVNTTIRESALLPCSIPTTDTMDLRYLRFYLQDDTKKVLFSFNKGREMPEHVNDPYINRVSAFPQDMVEGNISVLLNNLTLGDNGRIFEVYAAVLDGNGTRKYRLENTEVCIINLHVGVPYKNLRLAVNTETMTAVCTMHGGFPAPEIHWTLLYNNSEHLVDLREAHTTTVQDPENHLYSSSSTLHIPAGPYQAVTCCSHNPTLNKTFSTTYTLSKGAAVWSLPGRSAGLIAAAAVLLTALQQL